jgi:hypothetical protein
MIRSRLTALISGGVILGLVGALLPGSAAQAHVPTRSPLPRLYYSLSDDGADGQVVLFGGGPLGGSGLLGDTWTWDGSTWTKRFPAHAPSPREHAAMAYDAAMGKVVLFGGGQALNDTWMWDGTDWTQLHPAHSPPPFVGAMAYFPPDKELVLFTHSDAWTWDGTDWRQHPGGGTGDFGSVGLTYDAAHQYLLMFGGFDGDDYDDETETWDGTSWTFRNPAHAPKQRDNAAMAYDPVVGRVVLFGGRHYEDTWTWDGTDWKRQSPRDRPQANGPIAFDAAQGDVVSFIYDGSTWTWNGRNWRLHLAGSIGIKSPNSGPPGVFALLQLWGFASDEQVRLTFDDSVHGSTLLGDAQVNGDGWVVAGVTIPNNATPGKQFIVAEGLTSHQVAKARFNVT